MQLEFINKKYSVKNKDLINQQKREDNITRNTNYRKRIEQLHKKYVNNFIISPRKYAPQKPVDNITHIYAELRDNSISGLDIEQTPEKNQMSNIHGSKLIGDINNYSKDLQEISQNELNKNDEH